MKNPLQILIILVVLLSTSCKKPVDYYSAAVYAGYANPIMSMELKIDRLKQGYGDAPSNMQEGVKMQVTYQKTQLEELKELMGNTESDPMISAAYALLENKLNVAEAEKTQELLKIVDNAQSMEQLGEGLAPLQSYYEEIYEKRDALYKTYYDEMTAYADANDIEVTFHGPGILPGINDTREKP